MLLVAIAAANETAAAGMLFYLLVYTLMNIGAFAIVMSVSHHSEERLYIDDYVGLGWSQPLLGVFLTVFLLSLAGFSDLEPRHHFLHSFCLATQFFRRYR